jgi:hypothetical protein
MIPQPRIHSNSAFGFSLERRQKATFPPANFVRPCPPGTTQTYQTASGGFVGGNCPPPAPYPQEFLSTSFHFDETGYLESFNARGDAASDPVAKAAYTKATANQTGLTDRDLFTALKHAGAKYGPDDKSAFVKSLPLAGLETFLGKVKLISAELQLPGEEVTDPYLYGEMSWKVKIKATRADNSTITYRLEFEQFQGHLTALCELFSKAPCNIWKGSEDN